MAETKIFARLKADHDRHRELLDRIDKTHGDSEDRRTLFEMFRVEVTAHAASEEMSLYATMLANPDLRDDAQHSVSEHKEIEDFLTDLFEMDFASTGWLTRFRTMKDRYLHHIDEEEEELFSKARKAKLDLQELGMQMLERKEQLEREPSFPNRPIPREEALSIWQKESGIKLDTAALAWWEIFASLKGLAIWISAAREYADGRNTDPVNAFSGWYCLAFHNKVLADRLGTA